ncbi:MAG: glycine-rich domain-containing protein-like, partial [Thermoanaerobacterium sp.]|nr:glycine-rich domain-containing protein-like [Thermoanaerobacterium sp.]
IKTLEEIQDKYIKFLYLCKTYPDKPITPTYEIDEMWHLHMLHPRSYYNDCMSYFGTILDHNAGFGKEEEEYEVLIDMYDETKNLWNKEFDQKFYEAEIAQEVKLYYEIMNKAFQEDVRTCYGAPLKAAKEKELVTN